MAKRNKGARKLPVVDAYQGPPPSGMPDGSGFEWGQGLFLDVKDGPNAKDGALWDGNQWESRDLALMLRRDWQSGQLDNALTLPVRSSTWQIVPGKGDTGEAEKVKEWLTRPAVAGGMRTPFQMVIAQMTSAVLYRYATMGCGYKLDQSDGVTALFSDIALRPASTTRLRYSQEAVLTGFEQDLTPLGMDFRAEPVRFNRNQSVIYIHGQHRNPINGQSDIEIAYWCWKIKQKALFLWATFVEGASLPRTTVTVNGDENEALRIAKQIARAKNSGVIATGANAKIDALDISGSGSAPHENLVNFLDSAATRSVMAGFLDLTAFGRTGGTLGGNLSNDAKNLFLDARQAQANEQALAITQDVIAPLVRYNLGQGAIVPEFKFDPLREQDQTPVMTLLSTIAMATDVNLSPEFTAELEITAAKFLNMDVDKVRASVAEAAKAKAALAAQTSPNGATPLGQQVAGVGGAVQHVGQLVGAAASGKDPAQQLIRPSGSGKKSKVAKPVKAPKVVGPQ